MQFTISAAALLAFASTALAQIPGFDTITKPQTGEILATGETYTVVWEPSPAKYDDETIAIFLLSGPDQKSLLPSDEPIATGIVNKVGTWDWAVPLSLGDQDLYGLIIRLESDPDIFQYSFPFHIEGGDAVPSNTTEPTASASATDDSSSTIVSSASAEPTLSSNATITTAAPPKTTVITSTSTKSTISSSDDAAPEPTETDDGEVSGAASNGMMGTFALIGAVAAAVIAI